LGVFTISNTIKFIKDNRLTKDIRQNGITVKGVVLSQECEGSGSVTFRIDGEIINYKLDSDCSLFQVGDTIQFKTLKTYNRYIFVNESISSIGIIISAFLSFILTISGFIIVKK
jgi:hypothetical protein